MDEDRLASELQRRTSGVSPRPDWAQRDLLPAVWREIDARPQPVLASRWSPLAGVAGLIIALLVLVIAVPRLAPQPPSATSTPANPLVMSTSDFAARLASGDLDGKTVLVDGGMVAYDGPPLYGPVCGATGPACVVGQLEGVTPRVVVSSPDIAVASSADSTLQHSPGWPWWTRVVPPVRGTLVFSVGPSAGVEYVGRVVANGDGLAWSPGQVKTALDVNARELDEVVLVNGWLTGLDAAASCAWEPSAIPGLPRRYGCGQMSWLADEPAVIDPQDQVLPASAVQVQPDAFGTYAPNPTARLGLSLLPQRAVYAVARRLYGEGCMDPSAPCWGWSVVGRLSQPAPDVTPPSLPVVPTPQIAPSPTPEPAEAVTLECTHLALGFSDPSGSDINVIDETGLAEKCMAVWVGPDASGAVVVENPDPTSAWLQISWAGHSCDTGTVTLRTAGTAYSVVGETSPGTCDSDRAVRHAIWIRLSVPIPAASVQASINGIVAVSPTPSIAPDEAGTILCPDETTGAGPVQIEDHTASVIECTAGGADGPVEDKVTLGTDLALVVTWTAPCAADPLDTRIELWYREPKGDPSDPSRFQPPYLLGVNRTHPTEPYACADAISGRQARIQLEQPISPGDVALFFTSDGTGMDSAQAGDSGNGFQLQIAADKHEYVEGESIAVTRSLLPEMDTTVTGFVHPMFGVEQLDGVIRFDPGPFILMCPKSTDLTGGVPLEGSMHWPASWSPGDPNAPFYDSYLRNGELILPAGIYRFYAFSDFRIGEACVGDRVELEASIIVTVR